MFGSSAVAIPFLLDMMKLPADLFQVFVLTDVLVDRLSNVLAAMHLFTFGVLTTAALFGMLHIRKKRLRNLLVSSLLLAAIAIGGTRIYLSSTSGAYDKDEILANMRLLEKSVPTVILEAEPNPVPLRPSQSTLSRIAERGIIRVGYIPDNLPFSYLNSKGELVGFDIDMAQRFAEALEVKIEFVPFSLDELSDALKEDYFDIAMSGIFGNIERVVKDVFFASEDYLNVTMAIVVPDYRDQEFATVDSMRKIKPLKVAVIDEYFAEKIEQYSNVSHEVVVLESPRDFFEQKEIAKDVDALIISAEAGAAWTLLYPDFQVANPSPRKISVPLVYVFRDDLQMNKTMDQWIGNKELDGTIAQVYDYWILGKGSEQKEPRWSIIRNVLGWVD
jgi:ABC-type amino acid transport substrate-binding protein